MTTTTTTSSTTDAERTDLLAALASARSALTDTVRGIGDEQAGECPTASALCLGGLIKHVASIEEGWLRFVTDGPSALRYDLPDGVTWADPAAGTAREVPQWAIDHRPDPRPCRHTPVCPATPGTHARRVVGIFPVRPVPGRPSALRAHAPDAAGPALRADDGS
ncbi:DUF664 domain-containing protein, partial [Streptomyces sp. NPDC050161]|uniref:mycothiol transferase n=1 Tax=Streptomyces sp. NPDC050161 TaxID=3365604 RepID=UPI003797D2FF